MKELFQYLLRGNRGLVFTVLAPVTAMLCAGFINFMLGIFPRIYMVRANEAVLDEEERAYIMSFVSGGMLEWVAILAAGVCFWWLCDKAFRCGTANGTSRETVIKTTLLSVPLVALPVTLLTEGIRLILTNCTPYFRLDSIYSALCGRSMSSMWADVGEQARELQTAAASSVQKEWFEIDMFTALYFFGALCIMLVWICGIYALRRKFGGAGMLIGCCATLTMYAMGIAPAATNSAYAKAVYKMFFTGQGDMLHFRNRQIMLMHPDTGAFLLLALVLIAIFGGVYVGFLRKTGIRPTT